MKKNSVLSTFLSIGLGAALLCTLGCSSPSTQSNTTDRTTYLYVGGGDAPASGPPPLVGSVAQFRVNSDGTLAALTPSAVSIGTTLIPWFGTTVTPSNQHLLILNGAVGELEIGQGGALTTTVAPVITGNSIAFTPNGQFAVVADSDTSALTSYRVGVSDALTPINTVATGGYPQVAVVDKSGRFVNVSNSNDDSVSEYTISAGGVLTPTSSISSGGFNPRALVASPGGFLYCANTNSGLVAQYSINASTGALSLVKTYMIGVEPEEGPLWISFDPSGAHAYIATSEGIAEFTVVASTGALTSNGTIVDLHGSMWGGVDPFGRFLFSAGADSTVSQYTISSTGTLTPNGFVLLGGNMGPQVLAFGQQ